MYDRVIPRDLFNESKLLKCLGQLALIIHEGHDSRNHHINGVLKIEHDTEFFVGFEIGQHSHSGDIFCRNINIYVNGEMVDFYTCLNSKDAYPLVFDDNGDNSGDVFNNDGSLADDFLEFIQARVT